jgi:hypothetical protein
LTGWRGLLQSAARIKNGNAELDPEWVLGKILLVRKLMENQVITCNFQHKSIIKGAINKVKFYVVLNYLPPS